VFLGKFFENKRDGKYQERVHQNWMLIRFLGKMEKTFTQNLCFRTIFGPMDTKVGVNIHLGNSRLGILEPIFMEIGNP